MSGYKELDVPCTISETLTWGKLKELLDGALGIRDDMVIDSVRLKGSSNAVYVAVDENNEIHICD